MKTTALQRRELNDGRHQGRRPYPIIWVCQHCDDSKPGPDGRVHQAENIKDGEEIFLQDDCDCGLTFAYHVDCVKTEEAYWEQTQYLDCGGLMQ